jgi:hypothetical protein
MNETRLFFGSNQTIYLLLFQLYNKRLTTETLQSKPVQRLPEIFREGAIGLTGFWASVPSLPVLAYHCSATPL